MSRKERRVSRVAPFAVAALVLVPVIVGTERHGEAVARLDAQLAQDIGQPFDPAVEIGIAVTVQRAIRQAGLQLGKDVSMIAHDDVFPYLNADNMYPSMSTTRSSMPWQYGQRIYLGSEPSRLVLSGDTRRGQLSTIKSAILFADMRGFTSELLAKAIDQSPSDTRVAIVASGGLSHFVVDEDLDLGVTTTAWAECVAGSMRETAARGEAA